MNSGRKGLEAEGEFSCILDNLLVLSNTLPFLLPLSGETIQGLRANLKNAIETLSGVDSSVAVSSGGELFLRFISLTSLENPVSLLKLFVKEGRKIPQDCL